MTRANGAERRNVAARCFAGGGTGFSAGDSPILAARRRQADMAGATKVLVVDDEPSLVDLLQTLLDLAGYEVTSATGGEEAMATLAAERFDVMVLDINMPRMDGFAVLAAMEAARSPTAPRVLVLTARYAASDVKRARTLGAHDYLSKPFSNKTLLARIQKLAAG
jgi:DNA-binding response OmpR family regulator